MECWQYERMEICCPSLVSLVTKSSVNSIRIISLVNMASLVNADINLHGTDEQADVDVDDLSELSVLCGLSNATSLKLQFDDELNLQELWGKDIHNCRMFENLKSLEIVSKDIVYDFDLISCFLEHSPDLQKLTLNLLLQESIADDEEELLQHAFFKREYLETVEIYCGKNVKLANELINLLGRHVKAIGNVIIT